MISWIKANTRGFEENVVPETSLGIAAILLTAAGQRGPSRLSIVFIDEMPKLLLQWLDHISIYIEPDGDIHLIAPKSRHSLGSWEYRSIEECCDHLRRVVY